MTSNHLKTKESESDLTNQMSPSTKLLMGLLSFLVLTFALLMAVEKVYNYDIWWHLKTGQWILEKARSVTGKYLSPTWRSA